MIERLRVGLEMGSGIYPWKMGGNFKIYSRVLSSVKAINYYIAYEHFLDTVACKVMTMIEYLWHRK